MNSKKTYLSEILPHFENFKKFEIHNFEIKIIEQKLAESFNKKNIYEALDIPDFKSVKDNKILRELIKLTLNKKKIFNEVKWIKNNYIEINNESYKLITFKIGELPKFKFKNENLVFFMYQSDFKKIFYCGKILKEDMENENEYLKHLKQ